MLVQTPVGYGNRYYLLLTTLVQWLHVVTRMSTTYMNALNRQNCYWSVIMPAVMHDLSWQFLTTQPCWSAAWRIIMLQVTCFQPLQRILSPTQRNFWSGSRLRKHQIWSSYFDQKHLLIWKRTCSGQIDFSRLTQKTARIWRSCQ